MIMDINEYRQLHENACAVARELSIRKNADYAAPHEADQSDRFRVFRNFMQCDHLGICRVEQGFLVRLSDKFSRLANLLREGHEQQVRDESVVDTLLDIINYCVLLMAYLIVSGRIKAPKPEPHGGRAVKEYRPYRLHMIDGRDITACGLYFDDLARYPAEDTEYRHRMAPDRRSVTCPECLKQMHEPMEGRALIHYSQEQYGTTACGYPQHTDKDTAPHCCLDVMYPDVAHVLSCDWAEVTCPDCIANRPDIARRRASAGGQEQDDGDIFYI